jgi:ubiquinone/menaquinone biosynthesis C-methylase UbiE
VSDDLRFQLSGNAAENYERYSSVMLDPFVDEMLTRTALRSGMSVLDVACGTGRVARAAYSVMEGVGDLHGLDLNPGMLSTAAALAATEGCDITWHEAPAESMPLSDDRFDVTICSMSAMFFHDLAGGLGEMVRVTKRSGTLLVVVFGPVERNPYMAAQAGHLDELLDVGTMQLLDHACRLGVDDIATPLGDLPVVDIDGDTVERHITIPRLADYLAVHIGGLPYAAAFQALPDDVKRAYSARVEAELAAYRVPDGTWSVPFALHFVSAVVAPDGSGGPP